MTERVPIVMETSALSLPIGVLSLSMVRLGVSAVTGAARAENSRDPAVSSSTEEMLADNPRDPAAMVPSPCTDRNVAVTVVSKDGRVGSDDSCWG